MKPRPILSQEGKNFLNVSNSIKRFMNGVGQLYSATANCEDDFWSWLAGFHEGEGHLNRSNKSNWRSSGEKHWSSLMQIGQKHREVLDVILNESRVGYVSSCKRHYKEKPYTFYVWQVGKRRDVLWVLINIYPHLKVEKKDVANTILKLMDAYLHSPFHMWTKTELDFLVNNYRKLSDKKLANILDRTYNSIQGKRKELRLLRVHSWTPEETAKLQELYSSVRTTKLAKMFGRTEGAVRNKAYQLRLENAKEVENS